MQLSDKLKEYLVNSLMRDKENLEREIMIKEKVITNLGIENGKEKTLTDDWKHKYFKLEEENCELKKKVKRLENDKTFHINELQKNNNAVKECETLQNKVRLLTEDNDILNDKLLEVEKENKELTESIGRRNKKVLELEKSQEIHIKQYKELLDKYDIATAMNKSTLEKKEVKRGRPTKEVK